MAWVSALPEPLVRTIGTLEILGAVGLILPALTGILPWLTPLGAAGLATVMVLAILFHATRREWRNVAGNIPLAALTIVTAYGRFAIAPF